MFFVCFLLRLVITNKNFKSSIKICSIDLVKCKLNKPVSMKKNFARFVETETKFLFLSFIFFYFLLVFYFYPINNNFSIITFIFSW